MEFAVDHSLPVALGVQLRGLIEYGVACGQLMPGDRLPSVRDMAAQLGIAPMTVSNVYAELQETGLIEAQITGSEEDDKSEKRHAGAIDCKAWHPAKRHADIDEDEDDYGKCGHEQDDQRDGRVYHAFFSQQTDYRHSICCVGKLSHKTATPVASAI